MSDPSSISFETNNGTPKKNGTGHRKGTPIKLTVNDKSDELFPVLTKNPKKKKNKNRNQGQIVQNNNLDQLKKVEEENSELKKEIKIVKDEKEKIENEFNLLKSDSENQKMEIEKLNNDVNALKNMNEDLENNKIKALENDIKKLESEKESIKSNKETITKELNSVKTTLKKKEEQVDNLNNDIVDAKKQIKSLSEGNNKLNDSIQSLSNDNTQLKNSLKQSKDDKKTIDQLKSENKKLNDELKNSKSNGNDSDLKKANESLTKNIDNLSKQLNDLKNENSKLKKQNESNQGMIKTLNEETSKLKQKVEKISTENSKLKETNQKEKNQKEKNSLIEEVNKLKTQIKNEESTSSKLKQKNEELLKDFTELKVKFATERKTNSLPGDNKYEKQRAKITKLENEIKDLKESQGVKDKNNQNKISQLENGHKAMIESMKKEFTIEMKNLKESHEKNIKLLRLNKESEPNEQTKKFNQEVIDLNAKYKKLLKENDTLQKKIKELKDSSMSIVSDSQKDKIVANIAQPRSLILNRGFSGLTLAAMLESNKKN